MKTFDEQPEEGLVWIYWGYGQEPKKTLCYWKNGSARDLHLGIYEMEYIQKARRGWEVYK